MSVLLAMILRLGSLQLNPSGLLKVHFIYLLAEEIIKFEI